MNKIPIVFSTDANLVVQLCVAITSLLHNSHKSTFYEIFILIDDNFPCTAKDRIHNLANIFHSCQIDFINVGSSFTGAFEIRGITKAAYYRLLIPNLFSQLPKIIYSDVDIIFQMDISDLIRINLEDCYIAGVYNECLMKNSELSYYFCNLGVDTAKYVNSGFLLMNIKKMQDDRIVERMMTLFSEREYTFQDQDIINIACKGAIKNIGKKYNLTLSSLAYSYEDADILGSNIHYTIERKPWSYNSLASDIWWEYYRRSSCFELKRYLMYHQSLLDYSNISIKQLVRLLVQKITKSK
jgi:UDP-glucose:(galactosyl)LPS alpha-1,2-glucosyltransferase